MHFRCGGSDEVEGINDSGRLKLKVDFLRFGEAGNFYTDLEHPIDIIAITPAKERERLKGLWGLAYRMTVRCLRWDLIHACMITMQSSTYPTAITQTGRLGA